MMNDPVPSNPVKNLPPEECAPLSTPGAGSTRSISSEELFAGQRVVRIQHAGEEYRLMITRNDRLILQK